jgi:uncharacterized OB-fold protein
MKPLPSVLPIERPYWDHARSHRLALQRCSDCGVFRFPASPVCADCDSDRFAWTQTTGRGALLSWVVFHKSYFTSFNDDIPYNVALVQLDDGPVICANIVGTDNDRLVKGMRLKALFDDVNDEFSILRFEAE